MTNRMFVLFIQENDLAQASKYADLAVNSDRYNPAALTNKGNTVFANGDYEKAAEFYKEALRNDSSCTEALYNLGKPKVLLWFSFCLMVLLVFLRIWLSKFSCIYIYTNYYHFIQ